MWEALFRPAAVAPASASSDRFKVGGQFLYYSKFPRFQGRLCPVDPKARAVQGVREILVRTGLARSDGTGRFVADPGPQSR
jgi:acyl-CoA synthetase (NDP forming)